MKKGRREGKEKERGKSLVRVVRYEGDVRPRHGLRKLASLAHVLAHVLVDPMSTAMPALSTSSLIFCNSDTVGAPGFSKYIALHPALMHSVNKRGLLAVRPEMSATRGRDGTGRSDTEETKDVPYLDALFSDHDVNSGPPRPVAPGPRNQPSTT